jgi:hypothetical protein
VATTFVRRGIKNSWFLSGFVRLAEKNLRNCRFLQGAAAKLVEPGLEFLRFLSGFVRLGRKAPPQLAEFKSGAVPV